MPLLKVTPYVFGAVGLLPGRPATFQHSSANLAVPWVTYAADLALRRCAGVSILCCFVDEFVTGSENGLPTEPAYLGIDRGEDIGNKPSQSLQGVGLLSRVLVAVIGTLNPADGMAQHSLADMRQHPSFGHQ